jgi:hypothetical protein
MVFTILPSVTPAPSSTPPSTLKSTSSRKWIQAALRPLDLMGLRSAPAASADASTRHLRPLVLSEKLARNTSAPSSPIAPAQPPMPLALRNRLAMPPRGPKMPMIVVSNSIEHIAVGIEEAFEEWRPLGYSRCVRASPADEASDSKPSHSGLAYLEPSPTDFLTVPRIKRRKAQHSLTSLAPSTSPVHDNTPRLRRNFQRPTPPGCHTKDILDAAIRRAWSPSHSHQVLAPVQAGHTAHCHYLPPSRRRTSAKENAPLPDGTTHF